MADLPATRPNPTPIPISSGGQGNALTNINWQAIAPAAGYLKTIIALAVAGTLAAGLLMWAMKPNMVPLYERVDQQDLAQITDLLRAEQIDFDLDRQTGLVLVPGNELQTIRMRMAANGLTPQEAAGFELLSEEQPLGMSQFMETARYQHALETELSRTISGMRNIEAARVHLALPKQSAFVRRRQPPSASVMLKMNAGRSLDDAQIASITHLVASSVPYMTSKQVTLVDQWGRLLSAQRNDGMAVTDRQFAYTQRLQQDYADRIEDMLTPILGLGKVKAKVNVELNFDTTESAEEAFGNNDPQLRNENTSEAISRTGGAAGGGVPGALTNQPPEAGVLQPDAPAGEAVAERRQPSSESRSASRQFELDKTLTYRRQAFGQIQRISAAVIVDSSPVTDSTADAEEDAEPAAGLSAEEVAQLEQLVREAVGMKDERGDSVVVLNRPFQSMGEVEAPADPPLWEQAWLMNLLKQVGGAVLVLFLIFGIIRPALKPAKPIQISEEAPKTEDNNQVSLESGQLPAPPQVYGDILNMARAMAADDPKRVATVVKKWVTVEE